MDGKYFVVGGWKSISQIKTGSKYFKVNLGVSRTLDSPNSDQRDNNDRDRFAWAYSQYKGSAPFSSGEIGNVHFYTDHTLSGDRMLVYKNFEEFEISWNETMVKEKGIDAFIGSMMAYVDSELSKIGDTTQQQEIETDKKTQKKGDPTKLFQNPGQATWEDVQRYMLQKNSGRI
jgi:hypothetical protein